MGFYSGASAAAAAGDPWPCLEVSQRSETRRARLSLLGPGHPDPSGTVLRSTQTFHLRSEPWDDEHSRTEEHCSIEVDYRQGVPYQPVLLAQGCREGQGPSPADLDRHGRHTEIQYIEDSRSGHRSTGRWPRLPSRDPKNHPWRAGPADLLFKSRDQETAHRHA